MGQDSRDLSTPRTDALMAQYGNTTASFSYLGDLEKLARTLERENVRLESLWASYDASVRAANAESDRLRAVNAELVAALQETVADLECESLSGDEAATQAAMNRIYSALARAKE